MEFICARGRDLQTVAGSVQRDLSLVLRIPQRFPKPAATDPAERN